MKIYLIAIICSFLLFVSGCATTEPRGRGHHPDRSYHIPPGPPPHAPAHGYRYKHKDGHDLEFDVELGVYIVLRVPDTYFFDDVFIWMNAEGRWFAAKHLDGSWHPASDREIPYRLKKYKESDQKEKRYHKKSKKKDRHDDDDED